MVAHSGGSYTGGGPNDTLPGLPKGSSSSSSTTGGSRGVGVEGGMGKPMLKKGPWTAAEDAILVEYVTKHGEGNWNAVQKNTSLSRCGKSCRLRWTNHLRPNLRKGSFTPEEELLIIQLHSQLGNKWARMAAQGQSQGQGQVQQVPPLPQTEEPLHQRQPVPHAAIRGRPQLQIPTRSIFQVLGGHPPSSQSPSPSPTPVLLSLQSYHQLKTSFTNSMSLFDHTGQISPSTSGLPSPHSPAAIISPSYNDPNMALAFPGFALVAAGNQYHRTSPLPSPTGGAFQFSFLPQILSPSPVYAASTTTELPSSQMYIQQVVKPEHILQEPHDHEAKLENHGDMTTNPSPSHSCSGIGLLEDLLEQTEHQAVSSNYNHSLQTQNSLLNNNNNNLQKDQECPLKSTDDNGWNTHMGSDNVPEGGGIMNKESMHEELSKLLQSITSPEDTVHEEFNLTDGLSVQPLDFSAGPATSEDGLELDMQQIASLFQAEPAASASSPLNNLPSIC
ncbi:hypothetical protein SAY87_010777 [Trapa incisa]|uniref:Uncharacterized protein n=1 Tax=Trapa incisa TaxID=236973 RepID=A0AAN7GK22_9MYRT|nr:hypothetical protein SAY87_010777 [Trapa incisa]